jgi:hypothetical protein
LILQGDGIGKYGAHPVKRHPREPLPALPAGEGEAQLTLAKAEETGRVESDGASVGIREV